MLEKLEYARPRALQFAAITLSLLIPAALGTAVAQADSTPAYATLYSFQKIPDGEMP
jgi:hypothetical protein